MIRCLATGRGKGKWSEETGGRRGCDEADVLLKAVQS